MKRLRSVGPYVVFVSSPVEAFASERLRPWPDVQSGASGCEKCFVKMFSEISAGRRAVLQLLCCPN